jgi:hypothetical protein
MMLVRSIKHKRDGEYHANQDKEFSQTKTPTQAGIGSLEYRVRLPSMAKPDL